MKRTTAFGLVFLLVIVGCARTWKYDRLEDYRPKERVPSVSVCEACHTDEYNTWKRTKHADSSRMSGVSIEELKECGACHENTSAHSEDPTVGLPTNPSKLSKTEQNRVCGKCHFNQDLLGRHAINPFDKHGLFMSVGFEGHKRQLSCLDCHSGHKGKTKMSARIRAHTCYGCHKSAILTMGIFQPLNYVTFGKTCQACHTIHGGSPGAKSARMGITVCVVCHFTGVALTGGGD